MKSFMIGINTLTAIEQPVYSNHIQFFYRLGKNRPNDTFAINTPRRMSIDRMRNMTAKLALENEFDYLLFIDDDVVVPINALEMLLDCDSDIAAGHTIIRGYPYENMFFKWKSNDRDELIHYPDSELPVEPGIVSCGAVGFSCALIKCSLLKKVPTPWFVTGTHNTEDIYFCCKAQKFVPDVKIVVDTRIKTAHALGTEYIDPDNKIAYREYYEIQYPNEKAAASDLILTEGGDRGDAYLEMISPRVVE